MKQSIFVLTFVLGIFSSTLVNAASEFSVWFVRAHHQFADGDSDAAITSLEQAAKVAENQASKDLASTFLFGILRNHGNRLVINFPSEAIPYFDKAISLRPDDYFVYSRRGDAYCELGEVDLCLKDKEISIAVATGEDLPAAYVRRAETFSQLNRFDLATKDREKAIALYEELGDMKGAQTVRRIQNNARKINSLLK